jgi:hypothetical protein
VKASFLISTVLLALSLTQAHAAGPAKERIAPATIELASCDVSVPTPCAIGNTVAAKTGEVDMHALPPADPKRQQTNEPATPVPEPQTFVMLMLGLVVLGFASRRSDPSEKFKD